MGEVYRARDTRLDRDVAIKVLPERLAGDAKALARFEREGKAVAALSHPNILAIHDFGEQDALWFAVTELLEGETLRERLSRERLTWRKALEIGIAIAEGLSAAHARGIVHRDLKPENVFLTSGGLVKILDFGLARSDVPRTGDVTSAQTASMQTEAGTVLGTVGYMSPEQVSGEPADARSDIFSLGCVLYEMLSGRRAFAGGSPGQTMAAILRDHPLELSRSGIDLPVGLDRVVTRCLEKNPNERFQTARDLAFALKEMSGASSTASVAAISGPERQKPLVPSTRPLKLWIAATVVVLAVVGLVYRPGGRREKSLPLPPSPSLAFQSLAVLPLANLTGDAKQEALVDGITDELISALARMGGPRVTSRISARKYKDTTKALPEIARELNVEGIVKGSVTRAGDRLQVKAELINASTDKHLWADSFERGAPEVAALHTDVAQAIARQMGIAPARQERANLGTPRTIPPEAYEAYVRGRFFWDQREFGKAVEHFQKALDAEPAYPAAYAGLAAAFALQGYQSELAPKDAFPKAKAAALKALELTPELSEGHAALGYVHTYHDYDFPAAEAEFKRAIAADPNSEMARHFYSIFLAAMLRPAEARVQIEKARELDPLSGFVASDMGFELYYDRKYDEAVKVLQEAIAANPKSYAHFWLGRTYQAQKKYEAAVPEYKLVGEVGALGHLYGIWSKRAEAEKILREIAEADRKPGYHSPYNGALTTLGLGNKDKTMEWLDRCYEERTPYLVWLLRDPRWDPMRSDPRFTELLRKIGFPQAT